MARASGWMCKGRLRDVSMDFVERGGKIALSPRELAWVDLGRDGLAGPASLFIMLIGEERSCAEGSLLGVGSMGIGVRAKEGELLTLGKLLTHMY